MKRRTYLTSVSTGAAVLAGCTALGAPQNESQADYQGERKVVYEHDDLNLRLRQKEIHLGDTVEFEVTNTGNSTTVLGCGNPWAIQQYSNGDWQHVTWTSDRYYDLCATELSPGDSLIEGITLSESEFERAQDEDYVELRSGQHRFLLLGSSPFLALNFDILDAE